MSKDIRGSNSPRSKSRPRSRRSSSVNISKIHQVEDESPPPSLRHQEELQEALRAARELTTRIADVLSSSASNQEEGSNLQKLHRQAIGLSAFVPSSSRTVGIVGAAGVGKSSLINSLLDQEGLARTSSNGSSCTCVVTEYCYKKGDGYALHIEYFSLDELRRQFRDLLQAYNKHQHVLQQVPSAMDITDAELNDLEMKAELASNTFYASFKARWTRMADSVDNENQTLNTMMRWVVESLPFMQSDEHTESQESISTIEELKSKLQELSSETDGRVQTCPWPFIRKIKVYLQAHILSKGLIIADLPGLGDLNSARQNITERYVRHCHQIFAVADIRRAITDESVNAVFTLARRASLSNVGIVCTRSDDIKPNEAERDWPEKKRTIAKWSKDIEALNRHIVGLQEELAGFSDAIEYMDQEDQREYRELQQDLVRSIQSRAEKALLRKRYIITVRNERITRGLEETYGDQSAAESLPVFCVSNDIYWEWRQKPVQASLSYLELSGILELRRHCIGIVGDNYRSSTIRFIKEEIPALLNSVDVWIEAGAANASVERKKRILDTISTVERELEELEFPESEVSNASLIVKEGFLRSIRSTMESRADNWSNDAKRASEDWQGWHHASFSAWCRNFGDHETRTKGSHCWNQEATGMMSNDLHEQWGERYKWVEHELCQIREAVKEILDTIIQLTKSATGTSASTRHVLRPFIATLHNRKTILLGDMENAIDDFHTTMLSIRADAISPVRTAIIGQLLEDTYKSANREYGSGSDRRRKVIIEGGFGSSSLFTRHRRRVKEKVVLAADALQASLQNIVDQQVAYIQADIKTIREMNEVLESERDPEFRTRLVAEMESVKPELGNIHELLDNVFSGASDQR